MASPIEDRLLDALCSAAPEWHWSDDSADRLEVLQWPAERRRAYVLRNAPVLTYRVDIILVHRRFDHTQDDRPVLLAIECDGHEFHDRTKQQAAYDRARDRELLLLGIATVRFTGSEIHHSAERCAHEALKIFAKLIKRAGSLGSAVSRDDIIAGMGG